MATPQDPVAVTQDSYANSQYTNLHHAMLDILFGNDYGAPYELQSLQILEEHVCAQIAGAVPYSVECNLAVLRLYLSAAPMFAKANTEICRKILTKALMNLPATHFTECLLLIPTPFARDDPSVRSLSNLEEILQCCNFRQFWESLRTDPGVSDLAKTPGFCDAIRRYMVEVIALTYQSVSQADVALLLNLTENSSELGKIIKDHNWIVDDTLGPQKTILRISNTSSSPGEGESGTQTPAGVEGGQTVSGAEFQDSQGQQSWVLGRQSIQKWIELEKSSHLAAKQQQRPQQPQAAQQATAAQK